MRYSESEIVEDILEHIHQAGGEMREWCVGTATSAVVSGQFSVPGKPAADQQNEGGQKADGLFYREAYTTFAAEEVVERLTRGFDLPLAQETASNGAGPHRPGKIVFVYRTTTPVHVDTPNNPATHPKFTF
jgi:hypothetical protein